jgi:glycosyltransferase involved in cell wall biosynthesis
MSNMTHRSNAHSGRDALLPIPNIEVILDLSRLISRVLHPMPTGVDRVEMAYARTLLALLGEQVAFAAVTPLRRYGRLDHRQALAFLDRTEQRWSRSESKGWFGIRLRALADIIRLRPRPVPPPTRGIRRYYVQASPHHLDRSETVKSKLRREKARLICLIHDLIPVEYPEYARPNGAALHRLRIRNLLDMADGLIANSQSTAVSVERFAGGRSRLPAIRVAHLGIAPANDDAVQSARRQPGKMISPHSPYFVIVSTIEPRKNHILLLNIWRRMIELHGPRDTPHLVVIGRRGWENENVVDMLERCDALRHHVTEYSGLADTTVHSLIQGARALLLPSFAEGFGMPVTEALAFGTPVICSDLPSLREAGCDIPDYIDPLDGAGWMETIRDYVKDDSAMRTRQLQRMRNWRMPTWEQHLVIVLQLVSELEAQAGEARK